MRKIPALLLTLAMIPTSYALELKGVGGVEILAINGKEVKSNFFSKDNNELEPGEHQIVVRYSTQFNNDELIESRPAIFTIDLQQDTSISVKHINNKRQAEKQIKAGLEWQVTSADKQYQIDKSDTLEGKGFMPYSDIEGLIVAYNLENNIVTAENLQGSNEVTSQRTVANGNDLISIYQQSSKEQKKAFRLWLVEQDMQ